MAFLDKAGLKTLTNKLVQGDAIKVASHRGHTVKKVVDNIERECANVSNPLEYNLENRVNEFRVGQGRDVDASGDVETGYSEIGLQGKTWQNLVDMSKPTNSVGTYSNGVLNVKIVNTAWGQSRLALSILKPSTTYTILANIETIQRDTINNRGGGIEVHLNGFTKTYSGDNVFGTFTTSSTLSGVEHIRLVVTGGSKSSGEVNFKNIIILEGDYTQTPVEELPSYFEGIKSSFEDGVVEIESVDVTGNKKDILIRDLGLPMRSLPNGICDEIVGGEHIQRVGKIVLDETFDYKPWGNTPQEGYFVCHADYYIQDKDITFSESRGNTLSDRFPISSKTGQFENISYYFTNPHLTVSTTKANSIDSFKTWVANNPITLYYQLVTPIITPIEPLVTTTKPLGHYTIKSDIAPVSTHTVQLNRAGQIERAIVDIAELKNRVDVLENYYDSTFLETQHKLDLLGLDYDLETGGI